MLEMSHFRNLKGVKYAYDLGARNIDQCLNKSYGNLEILKFFDTIYPLSYNKIAYETGNFEVFKWCVDNGANNYEEIIPRCLFNFEILKYCSNYVSNKEPYQKLMHNIAYNTYGEWDDTTYQQYQLLIEKGATSCFSDEEIEAISLYKDDYEDDKDDKIILCVSTPNNPGILDHSYYISVCDPFKDTAQEWW